MGEIHIYRVAFKEPPVEGEERTEFFFHSLKGIYEAFTPAQIGCKVERLWNLRLARGGSYEGRLCSVTREPIGRKRRKTAPTQGGNPEADNLHGNEK